MKNLLILSTVCLQLAACSTIVCTTVECRDAAKLGSTRDCVYKHTEYDYECKRPGEPRIQPYSMRKSEAVGTETFNDKRYQWELCNSGQGDPNSCKAFYANVERYPLVRKCFELPMNTVCDQRIWAPR
jgi:hypothetical protein